MRGGCSQLVYTLISITTKREGARQPQKKKKKNAARPWVQKTDWNSRPSSARRFWTRLGAGRPPFALELTAVRLGGRLMRKVNTVWTGSERHPAWTLFCVESISSHIVAYTRFFVCGESRTSSGHGTSPR